MWEKFLIVFLILAAIFVICKILVEYWLHSVVKMPATEFSKLSFWDRMAFGIDDFCKTIRGSKDLHREWVEEKLDKVPIDLAAGKPDPVEMIQKEGKERGPMCETKPKRLKEKM